MLENLVPSILPRDNVGVSKLHARNGRTIALPVVNTKALKVVQKMSESSLTVHGVKLFNCLPKTIRNVANCSVIEFNSKLDCFL